MNKTIGVLLGAALLFFVSCMSVLAKETSSSVQSGALFFANTIAGFHAILIYFFMVGWLIPFTSFAKRCFFNGILAGTFLFFRFVGFCPLTDWERKLRLLAEPGENYGASFIARNFELFGFPISITTSNIFSLILTLFIFSITTIYIIKNFRKGRTKIK